MKRYALSFSILTLLLSNFVFPAQIFNTAHHFFPQFPQPLYDVSCPTGQTALASATNPINGHLKAYLCVDNLGNVNVQAPANGIVDFFVSSTTISPLASTFGGIWDGRTFSCGTTNNSPNVTSAALFQPTDLNKVLFANFNNNGPGDLIPLSTITAFTNTSAIVVSNNANSTQASAQCYIDSRNEVAPLNAAAAACPVTGCTIVLPCGGAVLSTSASLFPGLPSTGIVNMQGCPFGGTNLYIDYAALAANTPIIGPLANANIYWSDITIDGQVQYLAPASDTIQGIVILSGKEAQRITVNNWFGAGTSGKNACIALATDGFVFTRVRVNISCNLGIYMSGQNDTCNDCTGISGGIGIQLDGFGEIINGGSFSGSNNAGNTGILVNTGRNGAPGDAYINSVQVNCGGTGTAAAITTTTSTTSLLVTNSKVGWYGNLPPPTNCLAVSIASGTTATFNNTTFLGNGVADISNAGTFINGGGNSFAAASAGRYTGAGTYINNAISESGTGTCAASTATITYTGSYVNNPFISVSDNTTAGGARISARTNTTATVTCNGATDAFDYTISPNKF